MLSLNAELLLAGECGLILYWDSRFFGVFRMLRWIGSNYVEVGLTVLVTLALVRGWDFLRASKTKD